MTQLPGAKGCGSSHSKNKRVVCRVTGYSTMFLQDPQPLAVAQLTLKDDSDKDPRPDRRSLSFQGSKKTVSEQGHV